MLEKEELLRLIKLNVQNYLDSKVAEQYADSAQARSWDKETQRTYMEYIATDLQDMLMDHGEVALADAAEYVVNHIPNFNALLTQNNRSN